MTTAGSLALVGSRPPRDSFVAQRLREAGAVILGKTNLSEWANFRSNHSSSGWSGRGGQTKNPYALDRNPSGSSSGSAAAAAANLCAAAVGTETDGSIVSPSSACSLVGIKPTVGLVSRSGIIPISHSQDTAGPMARTVTDAAILLGALTGVDPRDAATNASLGKAHTDYTQFLDSAGLQWGPHRRRPQTLWVQRSGRQADGPADRRDGRSRSGRHRPGGHSHHGEVRRFGCGSLAPRIQGWSERLPGRSGAGSSRAIR